jgi:hypothetical protein
VVNGEPKSDFHGILESTSGESFVIFVNNFKECEQAYYPFILSLDDPESIVRFYDGNISLIVIVDSEVVADRLRSEEIDFRVRSDDEWPWEVKQHSEEGLSRFSWHFIGRLGAEFLSLSWIVNEMTVRVPVENLLQP